MADLPDLANPHYLERINRAIDYLTSNPERAPGLDEVAAVAGFSPFHFHRVFRAVVGETVHELGKRVRLERALALLSHPPRRSLTEVALACGFGSSSDFSRSFRKHFGVAPRSFDVAQLRRRRRDELERALEPIGRVTRLGPGENPDGFSVRLRRLPARRVAYLRVYRPYGGHGVQAAAEQLVAWARARGLADGQWLGYQWDDPEIVALEHCRYDVGLEVPAAAELGEGMGELRLAAMTVAELALQGPIELELRALDWLYKTWLPRSGYAPDSQPVFEAWDGEPFAHGQTTFSLRLQLAVSPLA